MDEISIFLGRIVVITTIISVIIFTFVAVVTLISILVSGDIALCSYSGDQGFDQLCVKKVE